MTVLARRLLRFCFGIYLSVVCAYFFSKTNMFLLPLSAFIVMSVPLGAPFRRYLINLLVFLLFVVLLTVVWSVLHEGWLFSVMILYDRVFDIVFGGAIGILVSFFVFPDSLEFIFRQNISSLLVQNSVFFETVMKAHLSFPKKEAISMISFLHAQVKWIPSWTYQPGFNPGLSKNYRKITSFLNQMNDILFSLHALLLEREEILPDHLAEPIKTYFSRTKELFLFLSAQIKRNKIDAIQSNASNFVDDIHLLDRYLKETMTQNTELLSLLPVNVQLVRFLNDLKALRKLLIDFVESVLFC